MSLPTLRNDLAKIYEPKAPAPSQRLKTLQEAKKAGPHVFVAMAPTYPECDKNDLPKTLEAVADLDPITIFHEPINIRSENVARIAAEAARLGLSLRMEVFSTHEQRVSYAVDSSKPLTGSREIWALEIGFICGLTSRLAAKVRFALSFDKAMKIRSASNVGCSDIGIGLANGQPPMGATNRN